mgnify:CR=1 FL=1
MYSDAPPHATGGNSGMIMLIIIGLIILWIVLKKMGIATVLYTLSRKYSGVSSPLTTYFLGKIVKKMIKEQGYKVSKIDIVHQFGNCYQGLGVIDQEKVMLSITADKYGNVAFES